MTGEQVQVCSGEHEKNGEGEECCIKPVSLTSKPFPKCEWRGTGGKEGNESSVLSTFREPQPCLFTYPPWYFIARLCCSELHFTLTTTTILI